MTVIETPAADVGKERSALLYIMLSHTKHTLERFLKRQQRRNTPQSLEAAEYIKQELQTATAWLHEFKCDTTMHDAFAAPVDEIEAQIMQEIADIMTVWEWVKENGGGITRPSVIVFPVDEAAEIKRFEQFTDGRTKANVHAAAEWVRKQGEP